MRQARGFKYFFSIGKNKVKYCDACLTSTDFSGRAEGSDSWRACKKQCQDGAEKDISKVEWVVLFFVFS